MPSLFSAFPANGYLLYDTFTAAMAAAAGTRQRGCDPGPGALKSIDTNAIMSATGGIWAVNGTPAANNGLISVSQPRLAGRAFLVKVLNRTTINTNTRFGFSSGDLTASSLDIGFDYQTASALRVKSSGAAVYTYTLGSGNHHLACVMRSTGALLFGRNGDTGAHVLVYVYSNLSSTAFAKMWLGGIAVNYQIDDFRIRDLGGSYSNDTGIATSVSATSTTNQTATCTADCLVEHTITAATGVTQELRLRWVDDNNCYIIRMDQTNSLVQIVSKIAGVEVVQGSAAQTWTNGTTFRVVAIAEGATITVIVADVNKTSFSNATANQTVTTVKINTAGTNLICWPRTVLLPAI